jgi:hypothetical protein
MIVRIARQILTGDLVVSRIGYCAEEIDRDDIVESILCRQILAQKSVNDYEMRAGGFRIRESLSVRDLFNGTPSCSKRSIAPERTSSSHGTVGLNSRTLRNAVKY